MEYKYIYTTDLYKPYTDEDATVADEYLFGGFSTILNNNLDKVNAALADYGLLLTYNNNGTLENTSNKNLIIKSNSEISLGRGVNTLAIGLGEANKVLLLTFEPMKLLYNTLVPDINQKLVKAIPTKYSYFYIVIVDKLMPITDKETLSDLATVRGLSEYTQKLKDTGDALATLIKMVKQEKKIKNPEPIIKELTNVRKRYMTMMKAVPELNKLRIELDIHKGNWKYGIGSNGKKLVAIDPFVIFYGVLKDEIPLFNKMGKKLLKLISK